MHFIQHTMYIPFSIYTRIPAMFKGLNVTGEQANEAGAKSIQSKKESNDQTSTQSSTTPDPRYQ